MKEELTEIYQTLLKELGPQNWWPADSKPEIVLGAILTQNTSWKNVEKALSQLKKHSSFDPYQVAKIPLEDLEELIRPAGFYKNKAKSILLVMDWFNRYHWDDRAILTLYQERLRKELLSLRGVGEETADVLLLYVFEQAIFVSDSYARRLFGTLKGTNYKTYGQLAKEIQLPKTMTVTDAQEFHGLIDEWGKLPTEEREKMVKLIQTDLLKDN
ncbi:deoxyribonuclease I [Atopobacter sp. AH10]|uniref:endonuclease III domain-containing protein n=1 Tax=Atopobacter sp. AH10 TaxID=2315861 RepID=UPI000EF1C44C|nr:deoxyribonuclease I [Atopobacter sp. AH10]RLK63769.1 deoxyribonuclease I [Atopobacter sp. AH10]